jgi:hypothetical protein
MSWRAWEIETRFGAEMIASSPHAILRFPALFLIALRDFPEEVCDFHETRYTDA